MIPQSFWRRKCFNEFVLGEPLPAADALDLFHVYLNVNRLLRKSHGWMFRRRMLDSLKRTKKSFLEEVAQKSD